MSDIDKKVWNSYHLGDCHADHPLRLLVEELRATRHERDRLLELARENGTARDAARANADRYLWLREIVTDESDAADAKAYALAQVLAKGVSGDAAVDAARRAVP